MCFDRMQMIAEILDRLICIPNNTHPFLSGKSDKDNPDEWNVELEDN